MEQGWAGAHSPHWPGFSHGNHPTGEHPCLPWPWEGHSGPALALSTSMEPAWSRWLLDGEHKSFKAANVFFFFLFWVKKMGFFSTLFSVTGMKTREWMRFVHRRPLPAQPSRNSLPSLACPLHILIFLAAWFFWESFVCARMMPDDTERKLVQCQCCGFSPLCHLCPMIQGDLGICPWRGWGSAFPWEQTAWLLAGGCVYLGGGMLVRAVCSKSQ